MVLTANAQDTLTNVRTFNYEKADSIALHFPKWKYKTYAEIVEPLTVNLKTEQEKFRVIYRWITDNISYSFSNKSGDPNKTLSGRKAVCLGYTSLLKEMCNDAGLECNVIEGWGKNKPGDINQSTKETTHAWNEVKLNGKWYLTDITWASGTYDIKKKKFSKDFDSTYFLPTPQFFVKQHLPKDPSMQMLDTIVSTKTFIKSCVWYGDAYPFGLSIVSPKHGYINQNIQKDFNITVFVKKPLANKDTLKDFTFIVVVGEKTDELIQCKSLTSKPAKPGELLATISCQFPPNLKGKYDVYLLYGGRVVNGFKINFY